MKKNRMMRLASILLVCVLLTTSVISGTFAKYTTSVTANDTARVAYWGFNDSTIENFAIFNAEDARIFGNGDGLLAPGASGRATIDFVYTSNTTPEVNAPEVDYTFVIDLAKDNAADVAALDANPNFYWVLDGKGYATFEAFEAAVENLAKTAGSNTYDAGTLPAAFYGSPLNNNATHVIGWKWLFGNEVNSDLEDPEGNPIPVIANNDVADTKMGNALNDLDGLTLTITITATQVD